MAKKWLALFILSGFLVTLAGCNTIGGMGVGMVEGAKKDLSGLKNIDSWMKENMW